MPKINESDNCINCKVMNSILCPYRKDKSVTWCELYDLQIPEMLRSHIKGISTDKTWSDLHKQMSECKYCTRHPTRQIDAPFFGIGNLNADIMFVGESPGYQTRQKNGITFCGNRSGDYFFDLLSEVNLHVGNCYITNVVKCQKANNEKPSTCEINVCAKFLEAEIAMIKPKIIVCIGNVAAQFFLPNYYGTLRKESIIMARYNCKLAALYHPAYLLRNSHLNLHDNFVKRLREIKDEVALMELEE